jgi:hypothetical protein
MEGGRMKTFAEAIEHVSILKKPGDFTRLRDGLQLFDDDARNCPTLWLTMGQRLSLLLDDIEGMRDINDINEVLSLHMYTTFMYGLTVGREMERVELDDRLVTQ